MKSNTILFAAYIIAANLIQPVFGQYQQFPDTTPSHGYAAGTHHGTHSSYHQPSPYPATAPHSHEAYHYENFFDGNGSTAFGENPQARSQSNIYAGYSFAFTKLHLKESFEAMIFDFATGTHHLVPFDYDYEMTPRIWIGLQGSRGTGFRTSWWRYNESSSGFNFTNNGFQVPAATATSVIFPASVVAPNFGDELNVASSAKASTLDFEGTYSFHLGRASGIVGGGLRVARSSQLSEAVVTPGPFSNSPDSSLNWSRRFDGVGPVFTANGKLPLGQRGLYALGGGNASFLFGNKTIERTVINDSTPFPNQGLPILSFQEADEIEGIYGIRLGLGVERTTVIGDLFIEGAYEGQLWTNLGAPTLTFAGFNAFAVNFGVSF